MKLLVIGGSYFLGRVFTMLASGEGNEATLVNRGRYSMLGRGAAREFHFDRHDASGWAGLPDERYDAVIDFCGYAPGDVRLAAECLSFGRYIFISTCDVYKRTAEMGQDETAARLTEKAPGPVGEYLYNKMLLERETAEVCRERGVSYTLLRPAFLYGPFNYAPRESWYIEKIIKGEPVPLPTDADSRFQFVYVRDAALAALRCCGAEAAENEAFNLCGPEIVTHEAFLRLLHTVGGLEVRTYPITAAQAEERRLPIPFPLGREESECFNGQKITRKLPGFAYTPIEEGMRRTWNALLPVYGSGKEQTK